MSSYGDLVDAKDPLVWIRFDDTIETPPYYGPVTNTTGIRDVAKEFESQSYREHPSSGFPVPGSIEIWYRGEDTRVGVWPDGPGGILAGDPSEHVGLYGGNVFARSGDHVSITNAFVADNEWHHIVITSNNDLYVDAHLVSDDAAYPDDAEEVYLAGYPDGTAVNHQVTGTLDEHAVYDVVLTPQQINDHFMAGLSESVGVVTRPADITITPSQDTNIIAGRYVMDGITWEDTTGTLFFDMRTWKVALVDGRRFSILADDATGRATIPQAEFDAARDHYLDDVVENSPDELDEVDLKLSTLEQLAEDFEIFEGSVV